MKRIMISILCLALMGCCSYTATDGTVSKSFGNCFKTAQDKVCGATADQIAIADAVIALLKPVLSTLVPGSAAFTAFVTAQSIKDTGCAVLSDLNVMIAFIQGINTQNQLAAAKGLKMAPAVINVQPLIDWRNKGK